MADVQVQVMAKARVLNCPIDAGYIKQLIKDGGKDSYEEIMVVYGKPDPNSVKKGLTLSELVEEFKTMVSAFNGKEAAKEVIEKALPDSIKGALDKITFQLREVYFVKKANTTGEFAFWFELNGSEITKGWPIQVDSISLKLWTTANPKILQEMNISSMQELLESSKNIVPV